MILTFQAIRCKVLLLQMNDANFLLFRAVEVQRTYEAAATPSRKVQPERAIEQ